MNNKEKGFTLIELGVVISILVILAAAVAPKLSDIRNSADEACAHKLLNTLKTSAMFYIAQENKTPQYFNDFVIVKGKPTGSITLTLDNISDNVKPVNLTANAKTLKVEFLRGGTATYYLNGSDVTADINM